MVLLADVMKGQTNKAILAPKLQRRLRNAPTDAEHVLFERAGFAILRFWNGDVFANRTGVLETIQQSLIVRATPSPPNPPLEGEG